MLRNTHESFYVDYLASCCFPSGKLFWVWEQCFSTSVSILFFNFKVFCLQKFSVSVNLSSTAEVNKIQPHLNILVDPQDSETVIPFLYAICCYPACGLNHSGSSVFESSSRNLCNKNVRVSTFVVNWTELQWFFGRSSNYFRSLSWIFKLDILQ